MTLTYRKSGVLGVLAAAAVIGLTACGGGTGSSPHVASLGKSSGDGHGNSTAPGSAADALPKGSPTQLLNEWAACMRRHGDRGQADPTITASKLINIAWSPATPGGIYGTNKGGQGNLGPGQYCRPYLTAAQTALQGGQQHHPKTDPAKLLKLSECMRANGIADFPDPSANGNLVLNLGAGGDLNPSNPAFQKAAKLCAKKTGVKLPGSGPPPPGTIELNGSLPGASGG